MPMDARDIESMIKAAIPDAQVTIRDLAGDGELLGAGGRGGGVDREGRDAERGLGQRLERVAVAEVDQGEDA